MSLLMVRKSAPAYAADRTEKIAQDSEIVALWQVLGDAEAYLREGKKNHNVKNVLAAAIKAAEKENPNDRSVLEAKKVLAQFDAGDEVIAQKNGYKLVYNTLNDGYWFYTKSGAGWGLTATNKVAAINEFNRLVNPAKDSAASVDSNAEEIVNHDRIPVDQLGGEANARKHGYIIAKKGGRVYGVHIDGYSDKLAKKTIEEAGYTVVGDADELNNYADLRAALSKMADIAKRLTDAKVSFKAGWTPDGIGEIILEFPNIESARKYNYYKLFNAWEAARSQIVPSWAVNIGGYSFPRIEGNRMTIGISHFST